MQPDRTIWPSPALVMASKKKYIKMTVKRCRPLKIKIHIFENEKMSTFTVGVVPPSASIPLTCVSRVQSYRPLWSHRCHCSRHPWWLPWPSKWVICPWAMQERWENSALSHNVFDQKGSVSREVPWHFVTKRCGSNPKTTKRSLCASRHPPPSNTLCQALPRGLHSGSYTAPLSGNLDVIPVIKTGP